MSLPLLPFHKSILETVHDPATSDLLVLARGLGLRRVVCTLLQIYDTPQNLVLLVNASADEEAALGEELGLMGCRRPGLRVVDYEMPKKDRQELYKRGGLISVTSRILVVDMLQNDIPVELITGILILHAEKVSATSLEAFVVRLFREKNDAGFLKAFSDEPEHITSGMSPLKNIMQALQLRSVHIYPRFHEDVKQSLERRRADVVELFQPLTENMADIHTAIVQCMTLTLNELKRSNTTLELDDLNVENAYFRSFDAIVRRQLDPVWHKVGPRTKQLVADLSTLRRLLTYLLTYDPLAFHAYLETLVAASSTSASGGERQHHSPWLMTDAAQVILRGAKRRCYTLASVPGQPAAPSPPPALDDDEEGWAALDEAEGLAPRPVQAKGKGAAPKEKRPRWLPKGMDPVLEELPKWSLLADVLLEIEQEMLRRDAQPRVPGAAPPPGTDTVLILTSSPRTAALLSEFLARMDARAPRGEQGRTMLLRRLRLYLWWKTKLGARRADGRPGFAMPAHGRDFEAEKRAREDARAAKDGGLSEALRKKDADARERQASRRRVRGGSATAAAAAAGPSRPKVLDATDDIRGTGEMLVEAEDLAEFFATQAGPTAGDFAGAQLLTLDELDEDAAAAAALGLEAGSGGDFDAHYGLLAPAQTVLVRAAADDGDDRLLHELRPRFIVLFEPVLESVRRIEVYRSAHPGLGVRVYFMVYQLSAEEHKFLAAQRREKGAFERLVRERGSMALTITENRRAPAGEETLRVSSRVAGGRKDVTDEPPQVIVDMREFRSALPAHLHAAGVRVIPATLTVGDYVLTPDVAVERKSVPDLVQSLASGRLYTQCETLSAHYKTPVLLIEFEEHKAFSLETVADLKSYAKPSGKFPPKKGGGPAAPGASTLPAAQQSLQGKLVLLLLAFPRVRILWASSPHATAALFADLQRGAPPPDVARAVAIGADADGGTGANAAGEELLRAIPGVGAKNAGYVMGKVGSVRELCEMSMRDVQGVLGAEPGRTCWEFMHKGER